MSVKIACDQCGADISEAGRMPTYRVVLRDERLPNNTGVEYGVLVAPPVGGTKHFCDLLCLVDWVFDNAKSGLPGNSMGIKIKP